MNSAEMWMWRRTVGGTCAGPYPSDLERQYESRSRNAKLEIFSYLTQ